MSYAIVKRVWKKNGLDIVGVICLAQDGDRWWAFVNTKYFWGLIKLENFLTASKLLYCQEGFAP